MAASIKESTGFTVVELLIVVAIIGVLVAIALPQFQNYRTKTYDAAALSDLKTLKLYMEAAYHETEFYPDL